MNTDYATVSMCTYVYFLKKRDKLILETGLAVSICRVGSTATVEKVARVKSDKLSRATA